MSAFTDGYEAGRRGDDPRECPHPKMTGEANEWQRGHKMGCDMEMLITEQEAIHGSGR